MRIIPLFLLLSLCSEASACSAFLMEHGGRRVVGKNYDWNVGVGVVLVNREGVSKTAFGVENPVSWTSRYGSVTFNQYGQEFPVGGMNRCGLVIEALWLDETAFPPLSPGLPEIDNMQWIQYQLDVSADVDDVIANSGRVQFRPVSAAAVHYFIADRKGRALILESVGGVVHRYRPDSTNPPVLTNDPYDKCIRLLGRCAAFGGDLKVPKGKGSVTRFIRTAVNVRKSGSAPSEDPVSASFRFLDEVKLRTLTKWSIVYDLDSLAVSFRCSSSGRRIKSVRLEKLGFDCPGSVQFVNIALNASGDVSGRFAPFGTPENLELLQRSVMKTDFLRRTGETLIASLVEYQQTVVCAER